MDANNRQADGGSRALTNPTSNSTSTSTSAQPAPTKQQLATPSTDSHTGRIPVILDCDPGHDDAFAILLAALHPRLQLLGITTTAGNQTLHKTTTNALNVLHIANAAQVPVVAGRHEPLIRQAVVAEVIHGVTGLDGAEVPGATQKPLNQRVTDFIFETAKHHLAAHHTLPTLPAALDLPFTNAATRYSNPDGITIIAVGPLTNIALTLLAYPEIKLLIKEVVLMGGAIGLGNVTPAAEFNIYVDPEAASIVFNSGLPITMVPLEVTHTALCTDTVLSSIRALQSPFSQLLIELLLFFAQAYSTTYGFPAPPLHDPCAVAYVIDPSLFESQLMHVTVECGVASGQAGRTVCDVHGVLAGKHKNVRVCQRMDVGKFWTMMLAAIAEADKRSPMNVR